jgi:hypothetical protein
MNCQCSFCQFIELGKIAKKENCEIVAIPGNNSFTIYKYPIGFDFTKCNDKSKYYIAGMYGIKYCDKNLGGE